MMQVIAMQNMMIQVIDVPEMAEEVMKQVIAVMTTVKMDMQIQMNLT